MASRKATTGRNYGVFGQTNSPARYTLYGQGRLKVTGRTFSERPRPRRGYRYLNAASISFYLDETNGKLKVRVKYSNGVLKTATIALV